MRRWPPPLDVLQVPFDAHPEAARIGRPHPLGDAATTLDLDRIQLAKAKEALDLNSLEAAHLAVLDATRAEQRWAARAPHPSGARWRVRPLHGLSLPALPGNVLNAAAGARLSQGSSAALSPNG